MTSTQNKSLQRHKDSAFAQLIYESKFCINNNNEGNEAQLIKCIKRNMNEIIVGLVRRPNEHDDEDHNKFTFYVLNNCGRASGRSLKRTPSHARFRNFFFRR